MAARGARSTFFGRPTGRGVLRLLDVRRGEILTTSLLAFAAFSVIASYYFLKPISKSLFLATNGPEAQRFVLLWAAAGTTVVGVTYAALARRVRLVPLANAVMIALAGAILLFRGALWASPDRGVLSYAFYVFVSAYGVVATAVLWLSVNHLLEPRQARRLLGYVGAGAILGGIAGSFVVAAIVEHVGSDNVLWGGPLLLFAAIAALDVCFWRASPLPRHAPLPGARRRGALDILAKTPYLRLLACLIAVTMLCSSLADYVFNWTVHNYVGQGDVAAKYISYWSGVISTVSLPTQLLLTTPILRRFGVGPALLVLPLGMLGLSLGMATSPNLTFGTGLKLGDGALRYSVNKSAVELLYLPLPTWLKDRMKVFLDTVLDRVAGKGGAGLLLMLLLDVFHFGVRGVAGVAALLAAAWAAWALLLRREYVDAFRHALERGSVSLAHERVRLDDASALEAVRARLASDDPATLRHALDLLLEAEDGQGGAATSFLQRLASLAAHDDPEVAARALHLLARYPSADMVPIAEARFADRSQEVAAAAARLLHAAGHESPSTFLAAAADDPEREAHAAGALLAEGLDVPEDVLSRVLASPTAAAAWARRELALALSRGELAQRRGLVRRLIADPDPDVARVALEGAGKLRDPSLIPFLVAELRRPDTRRAARIALADLGSRALPLLERYLHDPLIERAVRERIPRALARMGTLEAHAALLRALSLDDPGLRHQALKALNRMAKQEPALHVPPALLESELLAECHSLARLLALVAAPGGRGPLRRLYERAVSESVHHARERAFRLLGLRGRARDWENAFVGLSGDDARLRASAVEFADSTLPDKLRRVVVPLIDNVGASEAVHRAGRHLEVGPMPRERAYLEAAQGADRWVAACAMLAAAEEGIDEMDPILERHAESEDPLLRETAMLARRLRAEPPRVAGGIHSGDASS